MDITPVFITGLLTDFYFSAGFFRRELLFDTAEFKMKKYLDIFIRFFKVGAFTFGGGLAMLPILERELTEGDKALMTKEAIADNYALAQCAPGIIAVNTSILSGYQIGGFAGGLSAAFGVCTPSVIIILLISRVLGNFMDNPTVAVALMGVRSGVCALILRTLSNLWKKSVPDKPAFCLFALALCLLVFFDLSPVIPVVIGAATGIYLKTRRMGR